MPSLGEAAGSILLAGCGSDTTTGGGSSGASMTIDGCGAEAKVDTPGCTMVVATSSDDTTKLQPALVETKSVNDLEGGASQLHSYIW